LNWKRASRTGPFFVMNDGMVVVHELEIRGVVHAEERIGRRARASDRGLRVTACAAHEIEARADSLVDFLLLGEIRLADGEHLLLLGRQVRQHVAGPVRPSPHARVPSASELRREALGQSQEQHDRERRQNPNLRSAHFCSFPEMHGSHG